MTNIDITSVSILIIIVHVLQVAGLLIQFVLNRAYKGNGWWLLWSVSIVTGIVFLQLRVITWLMPHAIFFQNTFLLLGLVFLYVGIMRFLGRRENSLFIYLGYIIYEILITYFLYFEDNFHIRSIIFALGVMFVSFITGYSLIKYKDESVRFSSNFLGAVMIVHGCFYVIRLLNLFANPQLGSYMSQDWTTVMQYLFGLVAGLLFTFSLIFMVNQKLSYDMKTAKEHFEAIFRTSPDAVVITCLSDGKILNINDAFTKITGYSREDSIGKTTLELDLWKDYSKRDKMVSALSGNEAFEDQELEFKRKDGVIINGLLSTSLIDIKGIPHAITVTKEITRRIEAEKKLRQKNEELQIVNSEKDKLFSIVSHDLKNAFNIFLGYTDLLATDIDNLNRDETNSMAKNMNKSAKNLYKLLENLLEWSVFKRGLRRVNKENIFLYKLTDEITEQVSEAAYEKNISIEKNVPRNISIMADRQMLDIILRNLLSNALKFTHRGGLVSISAEKVDGNGVTISVSDTGIGMNEELRKNLFNPGVDSKRKGTENEHTSGLGLILIKEYTAKLGGMISVESEEGKGSRFILTLPAEPLI